MTIIEKIIQDAKLVPKTIGYKVIHRMELTETELEEIYNSNDPELAYKCALHIPGANIAKLEDGVLSSPEYSYWFAFYIPGANIVKLENGVLSSPKYSYFFAKDIPKANKSKLEEAIKKDKFWWHEYLLLG